MRVTERFVALSVAVIISACASAIAAPRQGAREPLTAAQFARQVSTLVVHDQNGRPYELPFLGGLDVPRPQFVDIDGDGDLDVFAQEYSSAIMFFENTGTRTTPRYEWRTDKFQGLDTGEWFRFVDLDGDSLLDLLSELPFSYIKHWKNTGSRSSPRFTFVDSLRDVDGKAIYLDRQNIPAITDIDCDGRLDFFVGRVEGVVDRLEQDEPGSTRFAFIEERYEGIEIIAQFDTASRPTRHGANALGFGDFDGDGDQDLFWGDYFENGVLLIENVGATCSSPSFQVDPVLLPFADQIITSGYNAPAPLDMDGDGDLDFAMGVLGGTANPVRTSANNFFYWERTAPDRFELRTKRLLNGIDVGSESAPVLVDLNGDGLLDMVIGNKIDPATSDFGRLLVFLNTGTRTAPQFAFADSLKLGDYYNLVPAFGDLDGDGDLDLLLGTWNNDVVGFRNVGTKQASRFVRDSTFDVKLERVSNATPTLADIDGDGDLDLLVGEMNGEFNYYRNDGTRTSPRFVMVSGRLDDLDVGRRSAPTFFDVDGDGLLDIVSGREQGGLVVYRNTGTRTAPSFAEYAGFALPLLPASVPRFADLDNDGRVDLVAGGVSGGVVLYRGTTPPR